MTDCPITGIHFHLHPDDAAAIRVRLAAQLAGVTRSPVEIGAIGDFLGIPVHTDGETPGRLELHRGAK